MSTRDVVINLVTRKKGDGLKAVEKDLESLGKKSEGTGGLFQKLGSKLSTLGDNVGKDLTGKFGAAGDAADKLGIATEGVAGVAGIAAGAVAGLGAVVFQGVGKLKELYDQTRDFNEVAGTTWEEGSRLIAVFDDLRVSSDEGAAAMGKLTKTVGATPEVLEKFGIEIVRAKDGTVDMTGTLANVATAFQQTTDPAKRAALGSALFGKSWQNMVPVLNQGGSALRKLIADVDDSQVATEKGAKQQDALYEATDNLSDAYDGLARKLAEDVIPALVDITNFATLLVDVGDKVGHVIGEVSRLGGVGKDIRGAVDEFIHFGNAADHVGQELERVNGHVKTAGSALDALVAGGLTAANAMGTQKVRAKEAADAYKEWTQSVKDLLEQQEKQRDASRELEDTTLALERAEIAAGDASFELSDKAHEAANAVRDHGASSKEAAIATEEHRRAVIDARDALNSAAEAAVNNAAKQAEASGTTLTAAERTKVYRDELVKMRAGVSDPDLAAALDAQIERLAAVAAQAQSAAANLRGFNQAANDAAGIEREFTGRDQSGAAVTRRATGGPVWPGQQYLVGEHGPEMITWNGNGPGYVMSSPETQRMSGLAASNPSVRYNPDGTVQFGGDPATYSGATVVKDYGNAGLAFPSLGRSPAGVPGGSTAVTPSGSGSGYLAGFSPPGGAVANSGPTYILNFYGITDIPKLVREIRRVEAANK